MIYRAAHGRREPRRRTVPFTARPGWRHWQGHGRARAGGIPDLSQLQVEVPSHLGWHPSTSRQSESFKFPEIESPAAHGSQSESFIRQPAGGGGEADGLG